VSDRPTYVLTLRAEAGAVPAAVRLRGLLKVVLRAFGFRCVEVREVTAAVPPSGPGGTRP
jgi:hypothetical protein